MMSILLRSLAAITLALPVAQSLGAQSLNVTLQDPNLVVTQGTTTGAFDANITNSSSSTIYLNGDSFSAVGPLAVDDSPFFANAPISLAPGASSGYIELFDVTLSAASSVGTYAGDLFSILGGADNGTNTAFEHLSDSGFSVTVKAAALSAPEIGASSAVSGITLLAGILTVLRGRRRPFEISSGTVNRQAR